MRTRLLSLSGTALLGAALVAAPLAVLAAPAQAAACQAPRVAFTVIDPNPLVLDRAKDKGFTVALGVTYSGCAIKGATTTITSPRYELRNQKMTYRYTEDTTRVYTFDVPLSAGDLENAEAGTWKATVTTQHAGGTLKSSATTKVLRHAKLTGNATPEPVRKGTTLTIKGSLTRLNWETDRHAGYADRSLQLHFKPTGGSYAKVKTFTTGQAGAATTTVKAAKDGCFRLYFPGSGNTAKATSKPDCVDVR